MKNNKENLEPIFKTFADTKQPTKADQQKAFDKLSWQQRNNAISFGSLSNQHYVWIKELIRFHIPKKYQKEAYCKKIFKDIIRCAQYTNYHSHSDYDEKAYEQWQNNRIKVIAE